MIYFIQHKETKLIKIGLTDDLKRRLYTLSYLFGGVELLGLVDGFESEESVLHRRFRRFNVLGVLEGREWFNPEAELLEYIRDHASMNEPPTRSKPRTKPSPSGGRLSMRLREIVEQYRVANPKPDGSKVSQVEVAVRAGINPSTFSKYITGRTDSHEVATIDKICKFFRIKDPAELFYFEVAQ